VKSFLKIGLGIVTSIGGFLDVGAIATTALAGAAFGFQLLWVIDQVDVSDPMRPRLICEKSELRKPR
jgi:hypothetical protein